MARAALTGLTAGELSPLVIGRADVQRYHMAARLMENFIVHPTGLLEFREGWMFLGAPKFSDRRCRLYPFVYSDQQAYMLEIGHLYLRFWKDGGVIVGGGGAPVEIATPFAEADLRLLAFTQSADVMWIFHPTLQPHRLLRSSHTSWTLQTWQPHDGPYLPENLIESRTVTVTPNPSGGVFVAFTNVAPLVATDVNRYMRVMDRWEDPPGVKQSRWQWIRLNVITSASTAEGTSGGFHAPLPVDEPAWRLGLYSDTTGWPRCGTIHEQRLWIAGGPLVPDRADGSRIGDYTSFGPGPNADDGVGAGAATPQVNRIRALLALSDIMAMSVGAEVRISGVSDRSAIAPDNVSAKPMSNFGSAEDVPAVVGANAALFVDRNRRRVMEYAFSDELQAWRGQDLTVLAEHMAGDRFTGGFADLAWQQNPVGLLWVPRRDGQIAVATYSAAEQVLAWSRHIAGGGAMSDSVAVLPGSTSEVPFASPGDEVWSCFLRNNQRTIERLRITDPASTPSERRCHLDCGMTFDNAIAVALTLSATAEGPATATAAAALWVAGDVGRFITQRSIGPLNDIGEPSWRWSVAEIIAVDSPTVAQVDIRMAFYQTAIAAGGWRLTVTELTGLPVALQGVELAIVADGRFDGTATSTGATLSLPLPGSIVHIGYRYDGIVLTLPFDAGPQPAVLQGRPARIDRVSLRLLRSVGGKLGTDRNRLDTAFGYTQAQAAPMAPPPALTRDVPMTPAGDWTGWPAYWLIQDAPLPFNVALQVPNIYSPAVQP